MFAYAALSDAETKGYSHEWKDKKIMMTPSKIVTGAMDTDLELHDLTCWDMSGKGAL